MTTLLLRNDNYRFLIIIFSIHGRLSTDLMMAVTFALRNRCSSPGASISPKSRSKIGCLNRKKIIFVVTGSVTPT